MNNQETFTFIRIARSNDCWTLKLKGQEKQSFDALGQCIEAARELRHQLAGNGISTYVSMKSEDFFEIISKEREQERLNIEVDISLQYKEPTIDMDVFKAGMLEGYNRALGLNQKLSSNDNRKLTSSPNSQSRNHQSSKQSPAK